MRSRLPVLLTESEHVVVTKAVGMTFARAVLVLFCVCIAHHSVAAAALHHDTSGTPVAVGPPSLVPWPRSVTFGQDGDSVTLTSASRVVYSSPLLAQAAQGLAEDMMTMHGVSEVPHCRQCTHNIRYTPHLLAQTLTYTWRPPVCSATKHSLVPYGT